MRNLRKWYSHHQRRDLLQELQNNKNNIQNANKIDFQNHQALEKILINNLPFNQAN